MVVSYKSIIDFPDYKIDKFGNVISYKRSTPKLLRWKNNMYSNHASVCLRQNNKSKYLYVHRLVLETFIGPCPEEMECCHNDGNPQNNKLVNLRWDTPTNNNRDKIKHGTNVSLKGECSLRSKLNELQVRIIRRCYDNTSLTTRQTANYFNISHGMVVCIGLRKNWKHI